MHALTETPRIGRAVVLVSIVSRRARNLFGIKGPAQAPSARMARVVRMAVGQENPGHTLYINMNLKFGFSY